MVPADRQRIDDVLGEDLLLGDTLDIDDGRSPVTTTVSVTGSTLSSAFTEAANIHELDAFALDRIEPLGVSVTVPPGRRSMILYWPVPSVLTERTFSIRAGLAASTMTPGSTAPDDPSRCGNRSLGARRRRRQDHAPEPHQQPPPCLSLFVPTDCCR
jgi:hypothetical protein